MPNPTRHYLDHAATTPLRDSAREALIEALGALNPGGQYASGRAARSILDSARETIASILHVDPVEVIFTASATESCNIALRGLYQSRVTTQHPATIITTPIEHPAVGETTSALRTHGATIVTADVDDTGRVTGAGIKKYEQPAAVATAMWANNETGTIQPIADIAAAAAAAGTPLHVDATQVIGKIDVDLSAFPVTTVAASAHKFGGPRSAGILIARRSPAPHPILTGGGQERGLRPGTVDVAAAAATAAALLEATRHAAAEHQRHTQLRNQLVEHIRATVDGVIIHTPLTPGASLPSHLSLSIPGAEGDSLIMLFDQAGIECSTGSACHSGVNRASHVLLAMGVEEKIARGAVRFTLGHTTTSDDIDAVVACIADVAARARLAGMA